MKAPVKCEIHYFPSRHLCQIYNGFELLRRSGLVDVSIKPISRTYGKPVLKVVVDNKHRVVYDMLDGFNWIGGTEEDNLDHFRTSIEADFYFKRSFNQVLLEHAPEDCRIFPLGLFYTFKPEGKYPRDLKTKARDFFWNNPLVSNFYKKQNFNSKEFEYYPVPNKESKILFLARLWDPEESTLEHLKQEREQINESRIACIQACRKEFGERFVGGLQDYAYSRWHAPDLLMPFTLTKRENYLKSIRDFNICIATTGLHGSIGGKFGEYMAASRAIVTEPLVYEAPGDLAENRNYLVYKNEEELLERIGALLSSREKLADMMNKNFSYYNHYLRSDALVLNTLLQVLQFD